jgi:CubicO group peptidase (beta-lactamase class C family)
MKSSLTLLLLAQFARENLFDPSQMKRTHFEDDPSLVAAHRVMGYDKRRGGGYRRWMMNARVVGGWGLKSCIEDQVRWIADFDANKLPRRRVLHDWHAARQPQRARRPDS